MMKSIVRYLMLSALACVWGTTARAQYDEPFIIDHNEPHYEYRLETGQPLEIGPKAGVGYGSVLIETNPTGADVYINDILQGKTPLLIDNVPDGTYDARLEMPNYLNYYLTFDVAARLQSHVTAGLQPRGKQYFDRKREIYTTLEYEHSGVNANSWGVGNSWGVYLRNINIEQSTLVHIGILNTVTFEGMVGYGFVFGDYNRFRITPKIGFSGVWFDDVENAVSNWRGYLRGGLDLKYGLTEQYALSSTLLYDMTGMGFRIGVLFYVN